MRKIRKEHKDFKKNLAKSVVALNYFTHDCSRSDPCSFFFVLWFSVKLLFCVFVGVRLILDAGHRPWKTSVHRVRYSASNPANTHTWYWALIGGITDRIRTLSSTENQLDTGCFRRSQTDGRTDPRQVSCVAALFVSRLSDCSTWTLERHVWWYQNVFVHGSEHGWRPVTLALIRWHQSIISLVLFISYVALLLSLVATSCYHRSGCWGRLCSVLFCLSYLRLKCLQIVSYFFKKPCWYFVSWPLVLRLAVCLVAMFVGRASPSGAAISPLAATAKGGKFSVEELYGFNKKAKASKGNSGNAEKGHGNKETKSNEITEREEAILAAQILEAARRLMERRRLEIYLKECDVIMEHNNMPYRWDRWLHRDSWTEHKPLQTFQLD